MAAAIASDIASKRGLNIEIASAGLAAIDGLPATPQAIKALDKMNIDLSGHQSRSLTENMINEADLILTMTVGHRDSILNKYPSSKDKTFTLKEYVKEAEPHDGQQPEKAQLDIPDPFGQPLELYQNIAEELTGLINQVFDKYLETKN